jgi:hypothetical protein
MNSTVSYIKNFEYSKTHFSLLPKVDQTKRMRHTQFSCGQLSIKS